MGAGGATNGVGRSTPRLITDAFGLYRRYPLLFLALAAAVIVPWQLIVLAATGGGPFSRSSVSGEVGFGLSLADLFVVSPLVSALHVHAVSDARRGEEPRFGAVARRGLAALPVVTAAAIMSGLGAFVGALFFLIPGLVLWIRWSVVAQAAAIERRGWTTALHRSWDLTARHWFHVIVFLVVTSLIVFPPSFLLGLAFDESTDVGSFLAGTTLQVLLVSFTALATALLYYDLRARREALVAESEATAEPQPPPTPSPADHGFDPRAFSDEDRPAGWYIDPDAPDRMRYWGAGEAPGWRGKRTRTPRKLRRDWRDRSG